MILKRLFSPEKGNQMKRWMRFQQVMSKKRWFEPDREKNGPITLFDFAKEWDAQDAALADKSINATNNKTVWRITDDSIIGGYSTANFRLVKTSEDLERIKNGKEPIPISLWETDTNEDDNNETTIPDDEKTMEENTFIPFVRWNGTLDTRVNKEKKVQRSGFCTILSPEFPMGGADLEGRYNGLEITCRSDGRPYSLNLKVESFVEDDLFQCFINIPPTIQQGSRVCDSTGGKFDQVVFLFRHFVTTAGGRLRARQRILDNSVKIQSIGITLMDGVDGDFEFDLARIRAVNYDESGVIGEVD